VPDNPLATVLTVFKSFGSPFLSTMVTGPVAPDQVKSKGLPAVRLLNTVLSNWIVACATAKAAAAMMSFENCIFDD